MTHIATLWIAPGVLLRNDIVVPSPPPYAYYIELLEPLPRWFSDAEMATGPHIQTAEFRLTDASSEGEVAHYELRTRPPKGFRWIVRDGNLYIERA